MTSRKVNLKTLRFSMRRPLPDMAPPGTHIYHDQSILRLDVSFRTRTGLSARNMIHISVATNPKLLKHYALLLLGLEVAILELSLVMCSKTAQVVLVENRVPPQASCVSLKSPYDLGSLCLPSQAGLVLPRGRDADKVPKKIVGRIFKASPLVRLRPSTRLPFASLL